jgi:hypothetical protein
VLYPVLLTLPVTTFAFTLSFALICVVLATFSRITFRTCLFYSRIVIVHDNNRIAAPSRLVLGMARVGGAWMVRVVCVFGPAFFVTGMVSGSAVFYNHNWPRGRISLSGDMARRQSGHRQYNQKEETETLHDSVCFEFEYSIVFKSYKSMHSIEYKNNYSATLSAIVNKA